VRAFNLADKYQTPVIILTDQFLSDSRFTVEDFELQKITVDSHTEDPFMFNEYKRYQITQDGISPRLYPGKSEHLVSADSDEHDERGHITEDLGGTAVSMVEKRLAKLKKLKGEINPPEEVRVEESDVILIGWGSSRQAILEAMELLKADNIKAGMIHFTEVWPLPNYKFPKEKEFWTVESNATGQLARLLKSEYDVFFQGNLARYDGLPLTGSYIRRCFHGFKARL
jgi:2-oxoglutarate ferredoxin oxidoreductase subunit alpha